MRAPLSGLLPVLLFSVVGCNGSEIDDTGVEDTGDTDDTGVEDTGDTDDTDDDGVPTEYAFTRGGADSVAYSGQVFRHLLIDDMKAHLGGMTARLDGGWIPEEGEVVAELNFYFEFDDSTAADLDLLKSTDPAPLQTTYGDVASGKDLVGKIAGNDPVGQHVDWSTGFDGGELAGADSPEALVRHWFEVIEDQAIAWGAGNIPLGPDGEPVPAVYVTPSGIDLQQMLEKFLRGAVAFSQAADDYLDDDTEGKGLLSSHVLESGASYTALEHQWDEGFGYFGAARTYGAWTDEEIAGGVKDIDGDDKIDLLSEVSWGHSANAGKRDRGAVAATDFTTEAWEGFVLGRKLLADTEGDLSDDQLAELQGYRDQAVAAWEKAIAATVVHYINATLADMHAFDTDDYDFADHAKHWSEMRGFSLALQFNPRSPMSDEDFAELQDLLEPVPVLENVPTDAIEGYSADLRTARALIGAAYGFDAANMGDDHGAGGW